MGGLCLGQSELSQLEVEAVAPAEEHPQRPSTIHTILKLPEEELAALRSGTVAHDGLVKEVCNFLQQDDVEEALAQLSPCGLLNGAKGSESWAEVLQRVPAAAATPIARRRKTSLGAPPAFDKTESWAGQATVEVVELLLERLLQLFERPFASLRFPEPDNAEKPDCATRRMESFDVHLAEVASALARRKVEDELSKGPGLQPHAAPGTMSTGQAEVALAYAANGLLQAKILQILLEVEGHTVVDVMGPTRTAAPAAVLLVFLSAGVELDEGVQHALVAHSGALLLAVHEEDQRNEAYFGGEQRCALNGFRGRGDSLLGDNLLRAEVARLANVESMPLQRRSYLQRAMISAICERIHLHQESSVATAAKSRHAKLAQRSSSVTEPRRLALEC